MKIQPDKIQHFALLAIGSFLLCEILCFAISFPLAAIITLCAAALVAWGKEELDGLQPDKHTKEIEDFYAGMAGSMLGIFIAGIF